MLTSRPRCLRSRLGGLVCNSVQYGVDWVGLRYWSGILLNMRPRILARSPPRQVGLLVTSLACLTIILGSTAVSVPMYSAMPSASSKKITSECGIARICRAMRLTLQHLLMLEAEMKHTGQLELRHRGPSSGRRLWSFRGSQYRRSVLLTRYTTEGSLKRV